MNQAAGNRAVSPDTRDTLSRLAIQPNEIIEHQPHTCRQCGEDLQAIESSSFTRRQEVDIPPVTPIYTEHRSYIKTCPHCHFENRGIFPEHIKAPIQYGANIVAIVGYLSVYQYIPYQRIGQLFKHFFNLPVSPGCIDTLLDNLAQKCRTVYESIKERILESEVVGADETGCRVGGKKHWFHVWQTRLLTFIVSFASRGHEVIEEYFPGGFIKAFYVSDCWASQLKVIWINSQLDKLLQVDYSKFHDKEKAFVKRMIKHRQSNF